MFIIAGLGNFGKKYENTYHNIGFMTMDILANKLGMVFDREKYKASIATTYYRTKARLQVLKLILKPEK